VSDCQSIFLLCARCGTCLGKVPAPFFTVFPIITLVFKQTKEEKWKRERKKEEGRHRDCFDLIVFQNRKIQAERYHTETLTSQDI